MSEQVWKEQAIHLMALLDQEKRKCADLEMRNKRLEEVLGAVLDVGLAEEDGAGQVEGMIYEVIRKAEAKA